MMLNASMNRTQKQILDKTDNQEPDARVEIRVTAIKSAFSIVKIFNWHSDWETKTIFF